MTNKRECQNWRVSSRLRGQQCLNCGRQRLCGPGEPTTELCWRSVENMHECAKKTVEVSRLRGVENVKSQSYIIQ